MIARRSILVGLLAAPAVIAAPGLMRLPAKRLEAAFYAEWMGPGDELVHRVDWYRRVSDGSYVPFERGPRPPDLFWPGKRVRAIRIGALPGSPPLWPARVVDPWPAVEHLASGAPGPAPS